VTAPQPLSIPTGVSGAPDAHRADLAVRTEIAVQDGDQDGAVDDLGLSQFGEHGVLLRMQCGVDAFHARR